MIHLKNIKVEVTKNNLEDKIIKKLKINSSDLNKINIVKQSLDARDKNNVLYVYEVDVDVKNEDKILKLNKELEKSVDRTYILPKSNRKKNVVIVGSGPAGLFCGYILALSNYNPIIIEQGKKVEDRINDVNEFFKNNKLNTHSNIQFGEGGAGTFSDGKLNTRVSDKFNRINFVLNTFIKFGAPKEILYSYNPHIGTDVLIDVIRNMRKEIINLGGTFMFNTKLTDIKIVNNKIDSIEVNSNKWISVENLVLAIGHSSRDTFELLYNKKLNMEPKPFAVGIRVIHNQEMIDESQYGKYSKILHPATYKLTYKASNNRGVYSFCMCPGGYVVNASSEENRLAINGMSYSKRDSVNSNSAIVVTVNTSDFGSSVLDGVKYQRKLEEKAYNAGNGLIPTQLLKDFKDNKISNNFKSVKPTFKGNYSFSNLNEIFDKEICDSIKEAFINFGKKIKGFDNDDTILSAVESRTSSPVRINRDDSLESNIKGIYPCGEGAGYAGGITSASIDGIKVAEKIILKA